MRDPQTPGAPPRRDEAVSQALRGALAAAAPPGQVAPGLSGRAPSPGRRSGVERRPVAPESLLASEQLRGGAPRSTPSPGIGPLGEGPQTEAGGLNGDRCGNPSLPPASPFARKGGQS